jgi:hypothetical protein
VAYALPKPVTVQTPFAWRLLMTVYGVPEQTVDVNRVTLKPYGGEFSGNAVSPKDPP